MGCKRLSGGSKFFAPLIAVCLGTLVYFIEPVSLVVLRNAGFDQFQRWHPRSYRQASVRIIDIDDESLKRLGQWPWPRTRIAELVTKLQDAKAAAIIFDVVFSEPDRTSPRAMLKLWQTSPEVGDQLSRLPDHDQVLAKAIEQGRVVLGFAAQGPEQQLSTPVVKAQYVVLGEPPLRYVHELSNTVVSLPLLESAAEGSGTIAFFPDADGVVRKVPLLVRQGNRLLPSLSAEALRVAQKAKNYTIRMAQAEGVGLSELRIGQLTIPVTAQGEAWLYYTKPVPERYLPAWRVLAGEIPDGQLKNSLMLIGSSAQGLMDLRFNPVNGVMPGVEAHAQMLEQVLTGITLTRPSWADAGELVIIVAGGLLLGGIALTTGVVVSISIGMLLLALLWAGAWQAFVAGGLLLDPAYPTLVLVLTYVVSGIVRHLSSERRQRWIKQAFSRYISPNLVSHLLDNPDALELGGCRQQCSFVFSDLADFTALMESMDPADAVSLLNEYLDGMIKIAFAHQGTLDRIVGDAVAVMFSAPVPQPDHQRRALVCALDMHCFATRYVDQLKARGIAFSQTRIGIHTGEVIVGNFGGGAMFDYRALGDPVNTASRLEGANKYLGTRICVSEATLSGCTDLPVRPAGRLLLKGKSQPLMVYEPLILSSGLECDTESYLAAYELMRTGQLSALSAFESLYAKQPDDPLTVLHLERLRAGAKDDLIVLKEK